eukprot:jgi/Mesen1/562/ME000105S10733
MGSTEEPDRKKRHLTQNNNVSSPAKKPGTQSSTEDKKVDAGMLHFQNQKLAQQLEVHREEIHQLESKFAECQEKQANYDETLMTVNRVWNQLMEDLELLAVRANANINGLKVENFSHSRKGETASSAPVEEVFLQRLLQAGAKDCSNRSEDGLSNIGAALAVRSESTVKTLTCIVQAIELQRFRSDELQASIQKGLPETEAKKLAQDGEESLRAEVETLRESMDTLHVRHREIASEVAMLRDTHAQDQSEMKRLSDALEDKTSQLETARRRLAALKQQQQQQDPTAASSQRASPAHTSNCVKVEDRGADRDRGACRGDAEDEDAVSLAEAQKLAARRLSELEEAHRAQLNLTQQFRQLQAMLSDEQHMQSARPYMLLKDQVHFLQKEVERYRVILEQLQRERDLAILREKEMQFKAEAGDAARRACQIADARGDDLESKLRQCVADKDKLQQRLEEAHQAAGRKETVAELKVMMSTLHKEMNMMQAQLTKLKETAHSVHALRAEAHSLSQIIDRKAREQEELQRRYSVQQQEVKSLKETVAQVRETEAELRLFCSMFERESNEPKDVAEARRAEWRALAQVEQLRAQLDEHALTLRVRAANEAEAACQLRLTASEAEVAELAVELKESLQAKNEEGDAYISEIETIGQAYEDMQTQNQRLLQQIVERDEYNMQLMAESVKAKQMQASLASEKDQLSSRVGHATAAADVQKQRVARLEEQAKAYLEQLGKAAEENRQLSSTLDAAKRRQQEAEREAALSRTTLEGVQKELEERGRKVADADVELEKERYKRKRLEEESETLGTKVARLGGAGGSAGGFLEKALEKGAASVEELQEEINGYKSILRCSVCHDRRKEVVITKCFHLFCSPCIQRNLEIRHRKCPGCNVPFGQNDVRNVYI